MRIFRALESVPADAKGCVVSVGNFDGVHEGHRALFRRNRAIAAAHGWKSAILTFDPHPTRVVAPDRAPRLLTTIDQRLAVIEREGIEEAFVVPFDGKFAQLTPADFVQRVLVDGIGARAVLVGDNFRFGAKQAGNVQTLRSLGEQFGFFIEVVPSYFVRSKMASSTAVREALLRGNVSEACRLLGRPYRVEGRIVSGFGIGSKQTVPTLNLQSDAEVLPANGVYITRTHDLDQANRVWPSITNVGMRPTFEGHKLTIETFLLSALDGESPHRIRLEFLRRVRDERRFESPEALKNQILKDVGRAQAYFRRLSRYSLPNRFEV